MAAGALARWSGERTAERDGSSESVTASADEEVGFAHGV
jgi:hypothetical protein